MENTRHKYDEVLTAEEFSDAAHPDYFRGATMHAEESAAVKERTRSTQDFGLQNMRSVRHRAQAQQREAVPKRKAKRPRLAMGMQGVADTTDTQSSRNCSPETAPPKDAFNGRWGL